MESLRKIGQVCREHYEKLILSFTLLIFAGAVYYLYEDSSRQRQEIRQSVMSSESGTVSGVKPIDLAGFQAALKSAEKSPGVDFSHPHFLFNPLIWESRGGSEPRKIKTGDEIGPRAMRLVKISPLLLSIAYGSASSAGAEPDAQFSYWTFTTNELISPNLPAKRVVRAFLSVSQTNSPAPFVIQEVKGDPKEPTDLLGELKPLPGEKFTFSPNKAYSRVLAYEAELRYNPTPTKAYAGLRKGPPSKSTDRFTKSWTSLKTRLYCPTIQTGKTWSITTFAQK